MGGVLGFVAIVVGLGTMIGRLMETSGGAEQVVRTLLERFGEDRSQLAMGLTGSIVAIPVFLDVGLIILVSLVDGIAKKAKRSLLSCVVPLLAGLAVAHAYIPATPGPVAVASIIVVGLGRVIAFGALCGIPGPILGGFVFGRYTSGKIYLEQPEYMRTDTDADGSAGAGTGGVPADRPGRRNRRGQPSRHAVRSLRAGRGHATRAGCSGSSGTPSRR